MLEINHLSYGWLSPVFAYFMSVIGCLLGLQCAARARNNTGRVGWLIGAAIAIGGTGIWVMHFVAMLGFSIQGGQIRYNVPLTLLSALIAMVVVGVGLFIVNKPQPTVLALIFGGAVTGTGVAAMHYTGMYAMRSAATIAYDPELVVLSLIIAVVAATVALWFTLRVTGFRATVGAALIMGVAVCGMHYTGMAAMTARHSDHALAPTGAESMHLLAPLIAAATVVTVAVLFMVSLSELEQLGDLPRMRLWSQGRGTAGPEPIGSGPTSPATFGAATSEPARPRSQYPQSGGHPRSAANAPVEPAPPTVAGHWPVNPVLE